jgi:ABC-2 type transport system ATP-binding protein
LNRGVGSVVAGVRSRRGANDGSSEPRDVPLPTPGAMLPASAAVRSFALSATGLCKQYRGSTSAAVDGIDFTVAPGEVVGLLGPNGAGKSTTIGMITTRIVPTSGEVLLGGVSVTAEPARARAAIGVTGQSNTLDGSCTVFENVYLHCRYHGMSRRSARERATEVLRSFRLEECAASKPEALSGGLMRRLQLARAMAHRPSLLLLDEPTNELDVPSQEFFWEQISQLRRSGTTAVLLATHLLEEAEIHCDRVLILDSGRIVLSGSPSDLRRRFRGSRTIEVRVRTAIGQDVMSGIERLDGVLRCAVNGKAITVLLGPSELPLEQIVQLVDSHGIEDLAARKASLKEVFLDAIDTTAWAD